MNLFLKTFNFTMGFMMSVSVLYSGANLLPDAPEEDFILEAVILPVGEALPRMKVCESKTRVALTGAELEDEGEAFTKCQSVEVMTIENDVENARLDELPRIPTIQEI
jgi:hypothetical protein